jgi:hypothetical protein
MNNSNATSAPRFKPGNFCTLTKAQLRAKEAPCCDLKTRVWACLVQRIGGNYGEVAQIVKKGTVVPMRLSDVAKELREIEKDYYSQAGIAPPAATTDWNVRRAYRELEEDGVCQRSINGHPLAPESKLQSKDIQIHVWFEPRKPERQIIKRTRIRQDPVPVQTGLFDRRILRQIEKLLPSDDPRVYEFLKLAQSDLEHAKALSQALARAAAVFTESLPLGELRLEKSDVGATTIPKVGRGRHEKSDVGATKTPAHNKEAIHLLIEEPPTSAAAALCNVAAAAPALPLTLAEIQKHDPSADDSFACRLYSKTIAKCPDLTDQILALCIAESYATEKNHGTGLLLHRVPRIAVAMKNNGWKTTRKETKRKNLVERTMDLMQERIARGQSPL